MFYVSRMTDSFILPFSIQLARKGRDSGINTPDHLSYLRVKLLCKFCKNKGGARVRVVTF